MPLMLLKNRLPSINRRREECRITAGKIILIYFEL
jgi:hypothetical protein